MSVIRGREAGITGKPEVSSFEDLEVFQRAYRISLHLHRVSLQFPEVEQFGGLADQMRRASKSICSDEMQVWLKYCSDLEYVDQKTCEGWRDEYRQIARMLQGLFTKWRARSDH